MFLLGQVSRGQLVFSGACTLEDGEPQPCRFPQSGPETESSFLQGLLGRLCVTVGGFGDGQHQIMMQELIMTCLVDADSLE